MENQLITALKNIGIFDGIELSDLDMSNFKGRLITAEEGKLIYKEGDIADSFYFLVSGEVNLVNKEQDFNQGTQFIGERELFGLEEVLEGQLRKYTSVVLRDSYLILIEKQEIDYLISQNQNFAINLRKTIKINSNETEAKNDLFKIDLFNDETESIDLGEIEFEDGPLTPEELARVGLSTEETNTYEDLTLREKKTDNNELDSNKAEEDFLLSEDETEENLTRDNKFETEYLDDQIATSITKEDLSKFDFDEEITLEVNKSLSIMNEKTEGGTEIDDVFIKKIMQAAELVNSNIKIDEVLSNIVKVVTELADADRGTLYLVDKDKNELWSKVAMGSEIREIRLTIGEGIAGWVAKTNEIINIKDAKQDKRFAANFDRSSGYETNSMLCLPIKNKNKEIVGVLQLLNSKNGEFRKVDEELLNTISIYCAIALENAKLVERLLQGERVSSLGKMANFLIQDIKKPVLVSKRYAEHLKTKNLPADVNQVLDMMLEQINHVADLVQTTSSYAEGTSILRTIETTVRDVVEDFCNRVDAYVRSRNCTITKLIDMNGRIKVDLKEFFQCFNHIVKNACDAMPDGGDLKISTIVEKGNVKISFKDNGIGIPETLKDKIFEPLMTYGKKEGTGLGLSITKKIIEDHGGKIIVNSELGEGAEFVIILPELSPF